jgi:inhibitor of KinA
VPANEAHISWASERHLRIEVGEDISPTTHARVQAVVHAISRANPRSLGVLDIIPAYATVLLALDSNLIAENGAPRIEAAIRQAIGNVLNLAGPGMGRPGHPSRIVEIPVCYAPAFALDLADVAAMHGLTPSDVIRLHTNADYVVHFVGFSPGFAYLGGLPTPLETPRLDKPRVRVPAGSVAIAGSQAGVYPHATPGGWRILGRTPLSMFDPRREPSSLLAMGDRVRFVEISEDEFLQIEREQRPQASPPYALDRVLKRRCSIALALDRS